MNEVSDKVKDVAGDVAKKAQKFIEDPKNQKVVLAATAAYALSKENKERNALAAGLVTYLLVNNADKKLI